MHNKMIKKKYSFLVISVFFLFVIFYPMLISIYVSLPFLIGTVSYILLEGIQKDKPMYIFMGIVYLINLEVNHTLPLFLTIISAFMFYLFIYRGLTHFRSCKICKPIISVVLLDIFYLLALIIFDFIFKTDSIHLDLMLFYSLIVDMILVVLI
jgi:hypothetical protein